LLDDDDQSQVLRVNIVSQIQDYRQMRQLH